ncbi:hypothetical protein EBB07_28540 [Paenibacillaceae bacterium]|nr:hypothetical protein EBB07_28540 [Paenibacillaceae bacterium]
MKEIELYEPVKRWLESHDLKVYSEVTPSGTMKRADVVGIDTETGMTTVVELKVSLSLDLLNQAVYWSKYKMANYVYVAVPWKDKKNSPRLDNWLVEYICKTFGIGLLYVRPLKDYECQMNYSDLNPGDMIVHGFKSHLKAKFHRNIRNDNPFKEIIEQYKHDFDNSNISGGLSGGGYVTPYRSTMNRVRELLSSVRSDVRNVRLWWYEDNKLIDLRKVNEDGWLDMNTILKYCETHYSSPKPSLSKALTDFEHKWCEVKKENRKLYFRHRMESENEL